MSGPDFECEIKLELLAGDPLDRLTAALGEPLRRFEQLNRYFLPASPPGWVVRLREVDGALVLTVKGPSRRDPPNALACAGAESGAMATDGIFVRPEREARVPPELLLHLLPESDQGPLFELPPLKGIEGPLTPVGSCRNTRWLFPHAGLTLELDRTEYADGSTEWELEVESDRPAEALAMAAGLLARLDIPFRSSRKGKFARTLEKLGKA